MMDALNEFQKQFMETLADIQENCVQLALEQNEDEPLVNKYYEMWLSLLISQRKSPDYGIYQRI